MADHSVLPDHHRHDCAACEESEAAGAGRRLGAGASIGACLYILAVTGACTVIGLAHPSLPLLTPLLWQALSFGTWIPIAWLLSYMARSHRSGRRTVARTLALGAIVIPLQALLTILLDAAFSPTTGHSLLARWIARLPVSIALYTGIMAIVAALAWRAQAAAERRRNARMQHALAVARSRTPQSLGASEPQTRATRLLVSVGSHQVPVDTNVVEWFGSAANYIVVNWDGREGLVRRTLRAMEEELDATIFARCHRTAIVNLAMVLHATSLSDGSWRLTMRSGSEIVVSRTYRDTILSRLGSAKP
ncbi:LytR/AlgR family response regulator transcription factor [Novosphingobium gossypii]|uniref:LytR/AlgR family response regulator transcription factor n=1 Tax=Novosphingobium gossypii TaxID=1604774 RepID=UPI003D1FC574